MHHVFRFLLRLKAKNFKKSCTKKSRSCIYDWRWCKSVRVNEEMYLRVCVCVRIAGLMSWTVCLPPTALSEPAVIQTDSCISSLSLRHSGTPTTSPRLQQRAKKKKKDGTQTTAPAGSAEARTRPHKALDGGNERAVLKFELFPFATFQVGVLTRFRPPPPPLLRKTCIKYEPSSLV